MVLIALLSGCASSSPSRFYTLNVLKEAPAAVQTASASADIIVAVGPVLIPDYLDKPEIVTRSGQNELTVNEFHRWAGSLESILSHAVIENLSSLLPSERFTVVRWVPGMHGNASITYRLTVDVMRFDATPRERACLESAWTLTDAGKGTILIRRSVAAEPLLSAEYNELVAAMSRTVEAFSREIAEVIKTQSAASGRP